MHQLYLLAVLGKQNEVELRGLWVRVVLAVILRLNLTRREDTTRLRALVG